MEADYMPFQLEDYIDNPAALARIKARVSRSDLARRMGTSQSYINKIERQERVTLKLLARVSQALRGGLGKT